MIEPVKPEAKEPIFYFSAPRAAALAALAIAFLVYCPFAAYGHERLGMVAGALIYLGTNVAYLMRRGLASLARRWGLLSD